MYIRIHTCIYMSRPDEGPERPPPDECGLLRESKPASCENHAQFLKPAPFTFVKPGRAGRSLDVRTVSIPFCLFRKTTRRGGFEKGGKKTTYFHIDLYKLFTCSSPHVERSSNPYRYSKRLVRTSCRYRLHIGSAARPVT